MPEFIKFPLLKLLIFIFSKLKFIPSAKRAHKIFHMKLLYYKDKVMWNIERAKDIGVKVGNNCRFYSANFFSEPYLVEIGNDVIVSGEVKFVTHDGGIFLLKDKIPNIRGHFGKILIGNNCFIGMGVILLPNVSIGDNCIIGAGSVVTNSFPSNSVIMGNPAKLIFKFEMYEKMKCKNIRNLTSAEFPFPKRMPDDIKKELLLKHFQKLPNPRPVTGR
jgi:acetyltransferase-like isoleucine patch superfamily enzyme